MANKNFQRKLISPIGKLHEALVAQRRTFLENAEARTYQRDTEIPPLPLNNQHPAEGCGEYRWPYTHSLAKENKKREIISQEFDKYKKSRKKEDQRYLKSLEKTYSNPPTPLTPEEFASDLLKHWSYEGKEWATDEYVFESFFPEDKGESIVRTHWYLPDSQNSDALEKRANYSQSLIAKAFEYIKKLPTRPPDMDFCDKISTGIHFNCPRWQPGNVSWGALKALDDAINEIHSFALQQGDTPFLSSIGPDEKRKLVIDANNCTLIWESRNVDIGDNREFWLVYSLAEFHGEPIPYEELAVLMGCPNSVDNLKYAKNNLKDRLPKYEPWSCIPTSIIASKGSYRLELPCGVRLIP
jgi:hypothetical protein